MYNRDENTKSKLKYIYIFTAPRRSSSRHAHVRSQCKKKSTVYGIRIRETDTDGKSHDEVHPRQYMQAGRVGNIGTLEHWNLGTLEPPWTLWMFRFQGSRDPCKGHVLGTGAGIDGAK